MENLKQYWWVILIVVIIIIWYYYTAEEEKKAEEKKKKFIGGGSSDCTEITAEEWNKKRTEIISWADFQPVAVRDKIGCVYWEKSGDVWLDAVYRFADDEILRKGFCKPR